MATVGRESFKITKKRGNTLQKKILLGLDLLPSSQQDEHLDLSLSIWIHLHGNNRQGITQNPTKKGGKYTKKIMHQGYNNFHLSLDFLPSSQQNVHLDGNNRQGITQNRTKKEGKHTLKKTQHKYDDFDLP